MTYHHCPSSPRERPKQTELFADPEPREEEMNNASSGLDQEKDDNPAARSDNPGCKMDQVPESESSSTIESEAEPDEAIIEAILDLMALGTSNDNSTGDDELISAFKQMDVHDTPGRAAPISSIPPFSLPTRRPLPNSFLQNAETITIKKPQA